MALPEVMCPLVLGRPCDIGRAGIISGRTEEYLLELEAGGKLSSAGTHFFPESVANLATWQDAGVAYLTAVNCDDVPTIGHILFRFVELAELEAQFAELSKLIPNDGGSLECFYLRRVVEICPGE